MPKIPTQSESNEWKEKKILDACCGSRMFWFDKKHPDVLYIDNRTMPPTLQTNGATITVAPDRVMDFRKLDLPDRSFSLVVFDPPHILKRGGKRSWMKEKYGELDKNTWRDDLRLGFAELFRVLKNDGVLIFKWNETDILLREVLELTTYRPLFGHPSGKASKTHWVTFMKSTPPQMSEKREELSCGEPKVPTAHCTGCTDPKSEGTHQGCTIEHGHIGCFPTESVKEYCQCRKTSKPEPASEWGNEQLVGQSLSLLEQILSDKNSSALQVDRARKLVTNSIGNLLTRQHLSLLREQNERMMGIKKDNPYRHEKLNSKDPLGHYGKIHEEIGWNAALSSIISHNEAEIKRIEDTLQ